MRSVALALFAALVLALAVPAFAETLTVTVIGPDNKPLANAVVIVVANGSEVAKGTTDESGTVTLEVENGTYLVVAKGGGAAILGIVTVAGNTSLTLNASEMHHANVSSAPITVDFTVVETSTNETVKLSTNVTIYALTKLTLKFPESVYKFPFYYQLTKLEHNGVEINATEVSVDLTTSDHAVVAHYTMALFGGAMLPLVVLGLLAVVIAIGIVAAFRAAKTVIGARARKFVKPARRV